MTANAPRPPASGTKCTISTDVPKTEASSHAAFVAGTDSRVRQIDKDDEGSEVGEVRRVGLWRRPFGGRHEHRHVGPAQQPFGRGSEDASLYAGPAATVDDDQIGTMPVGDVENDIDGRPREDMRLRQALSRGPRARDEPLQLPWTPRREIDALVTGGGVKQRVLHVQHVQLGVAVPRETRREDERDPRRIREADGSQDGSRGDHSLTSEGQTPA